MQIHDLVEKHLLKKTIVSVILLPFSWIYGTVVTIRRLLSNYLPGYNADVKVISVGNITTGGSGKTPFTIYLAGKLNEKGCKVAVSHRDYKGRYENDIFLLSDHNGLRKGAEYACDEAYLIAENLIGIPVVAGKNRAEAVKKIQNEFPDTEYVILDDSFQHFKLQHDYDFVLFNHKTGFGNGFMLPAGILREPLAALKDADCIILNGASKLPEFLRPYQSKVVAGTYRIEGLFIDNEINADITELSDKKLMLVSGIANPASFENTLKEMNVEWNFHLKLPDHYVYDKKTIEMLEAAITIKKIDAVVTTEKDHTKLRNVNLSVPVFVVRIQFQPEDDIEPVIDKILKMH